MKILQLITIPWKAFETQEVRTNPLMESRTKLLCYKKEEDSLQIVLKK